MIRSVLPARLSLRFSPLVARLEFRALADAAPQDPPTLPALGPPFDVGTPPADTSPIPGPVIVAPPSAPGPAIVVPPGMGLIPADPVMVPGPIPSPALPVIPPPFVGPPDPYQPFIGPPDPGDVPPPNPDGTFPYRLNPSANIFDNWTGGDWDDTIPRPAWDEPESVPGGDVDLGDGLPLIDFPYPEWVGPGDGGGSW